MVLDPSSIKMFPGEMADGGKHPVLLGQQRHWAGDPIVTISHRQTFKERYAHAGLFRHLWAKLKAHKNSEFHREY
jgi:hypothetical protein